MAEENESVINISVLDAVLEYENEMAKVRLDGIVVSFILVIMRSLTAHFYNQEYHLFVVDNFIWFNAVCT